MLKRSLSIIGLFAFILLPSTLLRAEKPEQDPSVWQLEKDKDGIQLKTRAREGTERRDIKAVIRLNSPFEQVENIIRGVVTSADWMYLLENVQILEGEGGETLYYFEWELPWPFDNRYALCVREVSKDEATGSLSFRYTSYDGAELPDKKVTRIDDFECVWTLTPVQDSQTDVTLYLKMDSEGVIPDWFVNWAGRQITANSLDNLRDYLKKKAP